MNFCQVPHVNCKLAKEIRRIANSENKKTRSSKFGNVNGERREEKKR